MMEEYLLKMKVNEIKTIDFYVIHRVVGGWIYIYRNGDIIQSTCFVPEPPPKPVYTKTPLNPAKKENDFHTDWVVVYQDKNRNRKTKHVKHQNQQHQDNWEKTWESYDNKIIGYHKANELGELLEPM